jgi:hypothetical protein
MVQHRLWAAKGAGAGYLCIGCLEQRIGRKLRPSDFIKCPINDPDPRDTLRLTARRLGMRDDVLAAKQENARRIKQYL